MLDPSQLKELVIRPTLVKIGLWSRAAENLVLGTGLAESQLQHLRQLGGGPALGLYQMEPETHDDIWETFLKFRVELASKVQGLCSPYPRLSQLIGNLEYATAMCRVRYFRAPAGLPAADDANGMAQYWKKWYNTPLGAGDVTKAAPCFQQAIQSN